MGFQRVKEFIVKHRFLAGLIISTLIALMFAFKAYNLALKLNVNPDEIKYVSDETWYVPASRNLARVLGFNVECSIDGVEYATLVGISSDERNLLLSKAETLNVIVLKNYSELNAIAVKGDHDSILKLVGYGENVEVIWGYPYPDKSGITSYYNLEHPPLGRFIIASSMILLGDKPINWRIPGIIEATLIIIMVYLIVYKLAGSIAGIMSSVVLYFDKMLLSMSVVAMLEIHVMFFLTLALLALVYGRYILSSTFIGLASSVKLSGLFPTIALYLIMRKYRKEGVFILSFILPLLILALVCSPLYLVFGFETVASSLISSIGWHTSIKHEIGKGPPVSAPWEWFLNVNPFYLHFQPDLAAVTNPILYITAAIVAIVFLGSYASKYYNPHSYSSLFFLTIIAGYIAMYVMGGRTQYSYYASLLTPLVAVLLGQLVYTFEDTCLLLTSLHGLHVKLKYVMSGDFISSIIPSDRTFRLLFSTAISMWLLSFWLHMPDESFKLGVPSFYSDIVSVYGEYVYGNEGKIPYLEFEFNRPPLIGLLVYLSGLLVKTGSLIRGGTGGIALYYIFHSMLLLVAVTSIVADIQAICKRLKLNFNVLYMFLAPSFIMFSCYDWTLIALALTLYSLRCLVEGRTNRGVISLALATIINPYIIIMVIPLYLSKIIRLEHLLLLVLSMLALNSPLLPNPHLLLQAYSRFLSWYVEGSLWLILSSINPEANVNIYSIVLGVILVIISSIMIMHSKMEEPLKGYVGSWIALTLFIGVNYVYRPQYNILMLPLIAVTPGLDPLLFYTFDILNVGIIVLWWSQKAWMELLFKYTPSEGYSLDSIVGVCAIIRNLLLLILVIRVVVTFLRRFKAGSTHYSSSNSSSSLSSSSESSIS